MQLIRQMLSSERDSRINLSKLSIMPVRLNFHDLHYVNLHIIRHTLKPTSL